MYSELIGKTVGLPDGARGVVIDAYANSSDPDTPIVLVQPCGACGEVLTLTINEITC